MGNTFVKPVIIKLKLKGLVVSSVCSMGTSSIGHMGILTLQVDPKPNPGFQYILMHDRRSSLQPSNSTQHFVRCYTSHCTIHTNPVFRNIFWKASRRFLNATSAMGRHSAGCCGSVPGPWGNPSRMALASHHLTTQHSLRPPC